MDFNHVVFAYNGLKDDYPYPAGSYKPANNNTRLIDVKFADPQDIIQQPEKFSTDFVFPKTVFSGISTPGKINITNNSGSAVDGIRVIISSEPANVQENLEIGHMPPFNSISVPFRFKNNSYFINRKGSLILSVNGTEYFYEFKIIPFYILIGVIISSFVSIILLCLILSNIIRKTYKKS
jgi:hypothetical protein